ncbi:MAG: homocysteine S-methyltransferase family protein, partial [Lachnospiraceae bacterium]|nr:homocysteine S-methyltransferase family protein [Lachnospiraceae bacterium]
MSDILQKINNGFVFSDGAMGTELQKAGLKPGELPERMNVHSPEVVTGVHKSYLDAGSQIITTNTFGANGLKYKDEELQDVVTAAIDNARQAISTGDYGEDKYVALDIGPTGMLLEPLGNLGFEEAVEAFAKTVRAAGDKSDIILIETMNDCLETKAAVLAAKENSKLPIFVTCTFDEHMKMMTGADPAAMTAMLEGLGVSVIGANCSLGPEQMVPVVRKFYERASVPVMLSPNAGLPRMENGNTFYDVSPEIFAEEMVGIAKAGARILGGCCGTTPEHIRAMRRAVTEMAGEALPVEEKDLTVVSSYTHAVTFGDLPVLIGERINPTGKKKFKQALRDNDLDYIISQGTEQQEAGAHVLDVNVGLPEIDEPKLMTDTVKALQAVCDLPLQIDTTDPEAMEKALRIYNGKPMINSVNGKQEVMDMVFPLAARYGGVVVGLTIDEDGIPEDAEGRVRIAEKIYREAARYGIQKRDIVIDPLAMTVSTDDHAGRVTLESVKRITDELGGKTSLGVSNISFGLPDRGVMNQTFFLMAMMSGLSAGIINPRSQELMKAWHAFAALTGRDENCSSYISYASEHPTEMTLKVSGNTGTPGGDNGGSPGSPDGGTAGNAGNTDGAVKAEDPLIHAVEKGLKERARAAAGEMLGTGADPLELIDKKLIPALDSVGKGFEKGTLFLPQLLMSAEAASAAFAAVREHMGSSGEDSGSKGKVVLATVKGDIHDIGKNIVRALLENYGFTVTDLGKDVAPEKVLEAVRDTGAPLVGLSAL